jgi:hypothetical protein
MTADQWRVELKNVCGAYRKGDDKPLLEMAQRLAELTAPPAPPKTEPPKAEAPAVVEVTPEEQPSIEPSIESSDIRQKRGLRR